MWRTQEVGKTLVGEGLTETQGAVRLVDLLDDALAG